MRASIYVRISMDRAGDHTSVETQREACEEFAREQGWDVGDVFIDNDLSATSERVVRPAFERLLSSSPEAILCWHIDRLVRTSRDLERVISLGVNVHAMRAGHLDLSTPAGRAVARTITAWSTYEGEQKAERQRLSNAARAARGGRWWIHRPFGNNRDGTLNVEEAEWVRYWAREALSGRGVKGLATEATAKGVRTPRGNPIVSSTLTSMLRSPRLAGIATYHGEEVGKGDWEAVLDETTWRSLVAHLSNPARKTSTDSKRKAYLVGIVRCGVCLAKCVTNRIRGRRIYVCSEGAHVSRNMAMVDEEVRRRVPLALQQPIVAGPLSATPSMDLSALRADLDTLRGRLEDAAQAYSAGGITLPQLVSISGTLNEQIAEKERALATNTKDSPLGSVLAAEDIAAEWGALNEEVQREIIRLLFDVLIDPAKPGPGGSRPEDVRTVPAGTATRYGQPAPA